MDYIREELAKLIFKDTYNNIVSMFDAREITQVLPENIEVFFSTDIVAFRCSYHFYYDVDDLLKDYNIDDVGELDREYYKLTNGYLIALD